MKTSILILLQLFAITVCMAQPSIEFSYNGKKTTFSGEQIAITKEGDNIVIKAGDNLMISLAQSATQTGVYTNFGVMPWIEHRGEQQVSVYLSMEGAHITGNIADLETEEAVINSFKAKHGDIKSVCTITSNENGVISGTVEGVAASMEASYLSEDMIYSVTCEFKGIKIE